MQKRAASLSASGDSKAPWWVLQRLACMPHPCVLCLACRFHRSLASVRSLKAHLDKSATLVHHSG